MADVDRFVEACGAGDMKTVSAMLAEDASLARAASAKGHGGWTGLHAAAQQGHLDVVRALLQHGADPNAREVGDNTYPLHWAAASSQSEIVRALLDAGGDVHGVGDVHELDTIGWATVFHGSNARRGDNPEVVRVLVDRGARHHIFSAMSVGDAELIRQVVRDDAAALARRMSKFEGLQTPLHFAMTLKRPDLLDLLIALGADLEAKDGNGLTALETAMLAGDLDAMRRLSAAGAKPPATNGHSATLGDRADSVHKIVPMICVPDIAAALDWYVSIGFTEMGRVDDGGVVNWGFVQFGGAQLMLNMHGQKGRQPVSLWFYTDNVDELYERLKTRQLEAAQAALAGTPLDRPGIEFTLHPYNPFYGGREFGIRDLNGYELWFRQNQ